VTTCFVPPSCKVKFFAVPYRVIVKVACAIGHQKKKWDTGVDSIALYYVYYKIQQDDSVQGP
jgi:hypothetical protein